MVVFLPPLSELHHNITTLPFLLSSPSCKFSLFLTYFWILTSTNNVFCPVVQLGPTCKKWLKVPNHKSFISPLPLSAFPSDWEPLSASSSAPHSSSSSSAPHSSSSSAPHSSFPPPRSPPHPTQPKSSTTPMKSSSSALNRPTSLPSAPQTGTALEEALFWSCSNPPFPIQWNSVVLN